MASAIKKCRVCGNEYEACRSANRGAGVFRWQEVACSPECGAIYLEKINESRNLVKTSSKVNCKKESPQFTAKPIVETPLEVTSVDLATEVVESENDTSVENE